MRGSTSPQVRQARTGAGAKDKGDMVDQDVQVLEPVMFEGAMRVSRLGAADADRCLLDAPPTTPLRENRAAVCSLIAFALIAVVALCWNYLPQVYVLLSSPDAVHAFVARQPVLSRLALVGINMLQIVLAFLPGEPIELAAGYAFGSFEGTLVCLAASALGSSLIYFAVRRWGRALIGVFFDESKLDEFSWLHKTARLELVMFIIFLIPGTPKDFLTYFAGLTRMRFGAMLAIVTVGRIPSVVTSTAAAAAFSQGAYGAMVLALAAMALLAALGGGVYAWYVRRERRRARA